MKELYIPGTTGEERPRAALVSVILRGTSEEEANISLDELERLLDTAGADCAFRMTQNKESVEPRTYMGSGKVAELKNLCDINGVRFIVFDCELSPSQIKNLEDDIGMNARVIDRTMLILDIFAQHAQTIEGKLQVELAQLRYTSPRLIGHGLEMSRQQGGNIAMRGPGETKLETDRRHLSRRISALEEELAEVEKNRAVRRVARGRSGIFNIAVAGYTNAGKSTLLNYLTGAGILAEDKLFATLDPTTRRYSLPCGQDILLTDTVGFIRNLPTNLVKAFHSTLEEVSFADAVLILIDASDPENASQLEVTRALLADLGASDKPVIYVYNKCDRAPENLIQTVWDAPRSDVVMISALTGRGVDTLVSRIEQVVLGGKTEETFILAHGDAGVLNRMYAECTVSDVSYGDDTITVRAVCDAKARGLFARRNINPPPSPEEF
ncbi:MAG: GTPase HflX [Eubacteriales bacterium]